MWKSPNGTIRSALDGTVFRAPILVKGLKVIIPTWTEPIVIARHAYGDVYSGVESYVPEGGAVKLVLPDGSEKIIFDFKGAGIVQGTHNTDKSVKSFARSCMNYALDAKKDLWFSAKDTISKIYDGRFKAVFQEIFDTEYKEKFEKAGITYFYTLIDDAVSRIVKSHGGMIWALKNYDGDVMSDMIATAYGSLAMMTSVLVSPDGKYEYEAAHGTVTRHYYKYLNGEETSTNPMATIFAWTGALKKRGQLDGISSLVDFAEKLERASVKTIEDGIMTKDLAAIAESPIIPVNSEKFLLEIAKRL
jgi:isocitrate dehydrogenase